MAPKSPVDEGGRKVPPTGDEPPVYWAVVKLIGNPQPNSWSLNVRKLVAENGGYHWNAEICFRVDEAPHHLLTKGTYFELFEGPKKVATGEVLE